MKTGLVLSVLILLVLGPVVTAEPNVVPATGQIPLKGTEKFVKNYGSWVILNNKRCQNMTENYFPILKGRN